MIFQGNAIDLDTIYPFPEKFRLCITSPPYWQLRDYGVAGQIGLEPTPEAYITSLCAVFTKAHALMTPDGSLIIVIGDTYFGGGSSTKSGNDFANFRGRSMLAGTHPGGSIRPVKPRKHDRLRVGEQIGIPWMLAQALRDHGWMVRQVSIWAKPNPMPGPFRRRLTSSHEYIIHCAKSMRYHCNRSALDDGKRIMRDVVTVSTSRGGHKGCAGFTEELITPFILAYSSPGDWVLDPFCGSGTVDTVACNHGRNVFGIDLVPL